MADSQIRPSDISIPRLQEPWPRKLSFVAAAILGVIYGILFRISMDANMVTKTDSYATMTISFLVVGSLFIGFLIVYVAERAARRNPGIWLVAPWPAMVLTSAITVLFRIEGLICLVFAVPVLFFFSSIGGLIGGLVARRTAVRNSTVACIAILPFLLAPAETYLPGPTQSRTVQSEVLIHATAATVWRNIERVPAISPSELHATWAQRIGFPRPVEATLSYEGVGGVRHATFEHGLLFIETVTAWEPEHRLAFTIKADTAHIPPTTLDEHVTIGGRYFDVLNGEYRLEPLPNGDILLHLTSHQRLSTDFNGYAGFWSDAVMQNLQTSILEVIQHRCEHA